MIASKFKLYLDDKWVPMNLDEIFETAKDGFDFAYLQRRVFTGITDKNGVELFEHDVVDYRGQEYEIFYSAYYGCFGLSKVGEFPTSKRSLVGHGGSSTRYSPYLWNWLKTKVTFIRESTWPDEDPEPEIAL